MEASASVMAHLIWGFGQLQRDEDAAVIVGATLSGIFQMTMIDAPVEAMLATVRERLGEALFEEANARGAVMGYDEVVSFAGEMCSQSLNGAD